MYSYLKEKKKEKEKKTLHDVNHMSELTELKNTLWNEL